MDYTLMKSRMACVGLMCGLICSAASGWGALNSQSYEAIDSMVNQWDGIENVAVGQPHDATATVWKDLKGGIDLTICGAGKWDGSKALNVNGGSAKGTKATSAYGTIEFVYQTTQKATRQIVAFRSGLQSRWVITDSSGTEVCFDALQKTKYAKVAYDATRVVQVAAVYSGNTVTEVYTNGVAASAGQYQESWGMGEGSGVMVGGRKVTTGDYPLVGKVYAIRLYSRVLTPAELEKNARIDAIRFAGALDSDRLEVTGSPAECGEVSPAYGVTNGLAVGDVVSCSAPKVWTNEAETVRAICVGYQVLTNEAVCAQGSFGEDEECAFDYVHPDCDFGAQLVWQWDAQNKVTVLPSEGGRVDVDSVWVRPGDPITLTATADDGARFHHWEDGSGAVVGLSPTLEVAAGNAPPSYKAVFGVQYYVSKNGSDDNDGRSWETAWLTCAKALGTAGPACDILFDDGVYSNLAITATTTIDYPLTLRSRNGRDRTTLYYTFGSNVRALTVKHDGVLISGLKLDSNYDRTVGAGAISMSAGRVENCRISRFNCAGSAASGVAANLSGGVIRDTILSGNHMHSSGGNGNHAVLMLTGTAVGERCTIVDNSEEDNQGAGSYAGCVYVGGGGTLRNSLIARNSRDDMNGGLSIGAAGTVDNCTIVSNKCVWSSSYGGVVVQAGGTLRNSIVFGGQGNGTPRNFTSVSAQALVENCCSPDDLTTYGSGNVIGTPQFADYDKGDFHVTGGACIDGGKFLGWMTDASTDLDGNARVLGERPDIGCYEVNEGELQASVIPSATYGIESLSVTLTASVVGTNREELVYSWYLSGAKEPDFTGSDKASVSWNYSKPGNYSVRLVVTNKAGERSESANEGLITVATRTLYVSKTSTPKSPFATWETAASSINDALVIAPDDSTIFVNDGVYTNTVPMILDKQVRLESVHGRDRTVVTRISGIKLVEFKHAKAVVKGFTFRQETKGESICGQGLSMQGGSLESCSIVDIYMKSGAFASLSDAKVTDCVFLRGRMSGGAPFFGGSGSVFDRCEFRENDLDANDQGAFWRNASVTVRNSLFTGNICRDEPALYEAGFLTVGANTVVENCTFTGNRTYRSRQDKEGKVRPAVIVNGGTFRNCIVWGNTTTGLGTNDLSGSVSCISHSCSGNAALAGENGNIAGDPKFRNADRGDYTLQTSSPCIDAGENREWMDGATDLQGGARILRGTVDMGCFEKLVKGLVILLW